MQIVFDSAFDRSAWPGPLGGRDAAAGEVWTGFSGLLGLLETHLGLEAPVTPESVRAAALVPALGHDDGFWRRSFDNDRLATARVLIEWRDTLQLHGWRGSAPSPRVADLARATREALPGIPDRLVAVRDALVRNDPGIACLVRLAPAEPLPALWQAVFDALEAHGTSITERVLPEAPAVGNLAAARAPKFVPRPGDDSLQFLDVSGPLDAAERVAAWIAALDARSDVLIVGGDPVLDAALHRHGLPTNGAPGGPEHHALLQVLPLVVAVGWSPPDPNDVLSLLALPLGPVPTSVATKLIRALKAWPGVDNGNWRQGMAGALDRIEDEKYRQQIRERLEILFRSDAVWAKHDAAHDRSYPAAALLARIECVQSWLRRGRHAGRLPPESADAALKQCEALAALAKATGLAFFPQPMLLRMLAEATAQLARQPVFPDEAGLACVHAPEAVAGPATRLVWWNFSSAAVEPIPRPLLYETERQALEADGVVLPDPVHAAQVAALRWRRPLLQTTGQLILVHAGTGANEVSAGPHPLWDEIVANCKESGSSGVKAYLHRDVLRPEAGRVPITPSPVAAPRREWRSHQPIPSRDVESPSSIGTLLGCPFNWTLKYPGGIRSGFCGSLPEGSQLNGSLFHYVIAIILENLPETPEAAEAAAVAIFDREGPGLAAVLFQPGAEARKVSVRNTIAVGVREMVRFLQSQAVTSIEPEKTVDRPALGTTLKGRLDLVIDNPLRVIDMKWSSENRYRSLLAEGAAYQLAAYGFVASKDEAILPGAYYVVSRRRLVTACPAAFPGALSVAQDTTPTLEDVWHGLQRSYAERRAELDGGILTATGIRGENEDKLPKKDQWIEGRLVMEPPCKFCDYGALCGRLFEEAS